MTKSQQGYPTDLNDTEWAQIAPYLPAASSTGAPRIHDWRTILNGMFFAEGSEAGIMAYPPSDGSTVCATAGRRSFAVERAAILGAATG